MQQTRVEQGTAYYLRFVKTYPTVKRLAEAKEEQVLKLWQGLGYYTRARNLHAAARHIVKEHGGRFPRTYEKIRALKGVGDYTAAAIAAFAYDLPYAVVDGNVARLLSRYLGVREAVDTVSAKKMLAEAARALKEDAPPHDFNQAIMEFGSRVCRPVNPACSACPLSASCVAFEKKWVDQLPIKSKKTKARKRYFHYLHIVDGRHTWMQKRTGEDIWKNLYEFPLIETAGPGVKSFLSEAIRRKLLPPGATPAARRQYKHILSHQEIHASFYRFTTKSKPAATGAKRVSLLRVRTFPVPRLVERYLMDET